MRVKLLKSVVINSVSNTEATPVDSVVEVDEADGRDLVKSGYAEETTSKVTAQAKQAPAAQNKMAPDASNKAAGTTAAVTSATNTTTQAAGKRAAGTRGSRSAPSKRSNR